MKGMGLGRVSGKLATYMFSPLPLYIIYEVMLLTNRLLPGSILVTLRNY